MMKYADISFFLDRMTWRKENTKYDSIIKYCFDSIPGVNILLCTNDIVSESQYRIEEGIRILSAVYETSIDEICKRITYYNKDLINSRHAISGDSLPIDALTKMINLFIGALRKHSSIIIEVDSNTAIQKKSTKKDLNNYIDSYISECKFHHTWKGSFGMTIESPLLLPTVGMEDFLPESIPRRTVKKLMDDLKNINEYSPVNADTQSESFESISKSISYYESIPEILSITGQSEFQLSVNWGEAIRIDDSYKNLIVNVNRKFANNIENILIKSSHVEEEETEINFIGFPQTLNASRVDLLSTDDNGIFKIKVKGEHPKIGSQTLLFQVNKEDYKVALEAQAKTNYVRVSCIVKKRNRGWDVINYTEIKEIIG